MALYIIYNPTIKQKRLLKNKVRLLLSSIIFNRSEYISVYVGADNKYFNVI